MSAKNPLAEAMAKTRRQDPPKKEKIHNANATPKRRGKIGCPVYLLPEEHARLKEIAEREEVTLEALLREGLGYVLKKRESLPTA